MKIQLSVSIIIMVLFLGIQACEEIGPTITLAETERVVLIEEFTGVRCVNCPEGSAQLEALLETYGSNLVAVSIHGGTFASPFSESQYDFRTEDGDGLLPYLNAPNSGPIGYPAAVVNRKWFEGEQDRMLFRNSWAGYIAEELQEAAKVRIDLAKDYDEATRTIEISVELAFIEAVSGNVNLSVMITENNIQDIQDDADVGIIPDYNHKHVLRDVISVDFRGDNIGSDVAAGFNEIYTYNYAIPEDWKISDCHIVVCVNQNDGGTLDVLQAGEIAVQ